MRVLTGIQPTNNLHIGNLFGALKPAVELQTGNELFMAIVDLHAITVPQDPAKLSKNITMAAATYIAAGIDPAKTVLFQQSQVPAHAELGWLLQTVARMGEVERMTQFKDKSKVRGEAVSVGLFTYPVLMAADILLYDPEAVPVGEDQKQHLELARDLAERFNRDFGHTFTVPKPLIKREGARILSLDDATKKMSKSAPSPKSYISILDDAETIMKKIRSAVTDSEPTVTLDAARPGVRNLLEILAASTNTTAELVAPGYASKGMKDLKADTAEALISYLMPIQEQIKSLMAHPDELRRIVAAGNERAAAIANKKIALVKDKMGLKLA